MSYLAATQGFLAGICLMLAFSEPEFTPARAVCLVLALLAGVVAVTAAYYAA